MNRPKILLLIPNLGPGGAQKIFRQQQRFLSDHFDVTAFVFNWDGSFEEDKALNVLSLDVPAGRNWWQKLYYFGIRVVKLNKLKKRNQIDLCISHLEGADYVNLLSRGCTKAICWVHGSKKFDANIKGLLGFIRHNIAIPLLYRRADKIVTVSKVIKYELNRFYHLKESLLLTINNGFDLNEINYLKDLPLEPSNESFFEGTVLITHCRFAREKNLEGLLEVFAHLKKQIPKSRLIILGDGKLRIDLLSRCNLLGLSTYSPWTSSTRDGNFDVCFMGYQSNPYQFLQKASLYVLSSNNEGFPLGLVEAMACGVPVVATDCPTGPREILDPSVFTTLSTTSIQKAQFGCLFPLIDLNETDSLKLWVSGILELLDDDNLIKHYSEEGLRRVRDFDVSKNIDCTRDLIDKTVQVS